MPITNFVQQIPGTFQPIINGVLLKCAECAALNNLCPGHKAMWEASFGIAPMPVEAPLVYVEARELERLRSALASAEARVEALTKIEREFADYFKRAGDGDDVGERAIYVLRVLIPKALGDAAGVAPENTFKDNDK